MPHVTYSLAGGLSDEQIGRMHDEALGLIETVGLHVGHREIRGILADHEGVTVDGEVVRFAPDRVEAAVAAQYYPPELSQFDYEMVAGAYALNVTDPGDGHTRPATTDDLRFLVKLADRLGCWGSAPARPTDIPSPELQEIALQRIAWENSPRKDCGPLDANPRSTPEVAEYVYEMAQALGRDFSLGYWIISPFRANADELDIIYRFLDRRVPMWVATMPIMGATCPISHVGAYVQSLAELLAGLTVLHLISRGGPIYCSVIDSVRAYPFDMRYGTFVYGSPEDILATLIQCQLNPRYGIPICAKSLLTWDKLPGPQAAAEKCAHTLAAALAGARLFTNAGLISVDEICSPEQLVIDYEIVQYVRATLRGFEFTDAALSVDAIREVGIGGGFLDHESTLASFREAFWEPTLFDHRMLQTWRMQGAEDMRVRARHRARQLVAEHDFELPETSRRALGSIYRRAERRYLG
ncbi:MAG TPA: trimethylamine methyltransferase family protein [Armatimonadota bacterium]|nr:trimethylamine methyltransferase family protein [Armatimonadota bacterium]